MIIIKIEIVMWLFTSFCAYNIYLEKKIEKEIRRSTDNIMSQLKILIENVKNLEEKIKYRQENEILIPKSIKRMKKIEKNKPYA